MLRNSCIKFVLFLHYVCLGPFTSFIQWRDSFSMKLSWFIQQIELLLSLRIVYFGIYLILLYKTVLYVVAIIVAPTTALHSVMSFLKTEKCMLVISVSPTVFGHCLYIVDPFINRVFVKMKNPCLRAVTSKVLTVL